MEAGAGDQALDDLLEDELAAELAGNLEDEPDDPSTLAAKPWVQRTAGRIVLHPDFELVVVILVCVNCVALAQYSPLQSPDYIWNRLMSRIGTLRCP
jgi:hypothetical protein